MKISVIGHTHTLKTLNDLPPRAQLALAEADLILHVGSVGSLTFLRAIQDKFGLTFAVYGRQDPGETRRYLEAQKVVEFANRRIGIVHSGNPSEKNLAPLPGLKRSTPTPAGLAAQLLSQFDAVDCVVFGHPPQPFNYLHRGVLVFNPGPLVTTPGQQGAMGVLDITDRVITGRVVPL
ncbi:MAG: metallophosphoesterase family protein [Anaerolineae bacterium]